MKHSTRRLSSAVALIAVAATAGCGDSAAGSAEWTGTVRDSAGIRIVTNPDAGMWVPETRWALAEELRIGVESGRPELQFGSIMGLDVDDEGRIYVLDGQAAQIRVFAADGEFERAFGRSGAGPGELSQAAAGAFVTHDGGLLVPDLQNARITRFSSEGEPAGSTPLDLAGGIPLAWAVSGDRVLFQQSRLMSIPGQPPIEGGPRDFILARDAEGAVADTIAELASGESFTFQGAGGMPQIRIFAPEPLWAVTTDGRVVVGMNSEYSLEIRDATGELHTILRRDSQRRPVSQSERDGMRRGMRRAWEGAGMPPEMAGQLEQAVQFEETWPALAALVGGPRGSLWVQRVDPDVAMSEEAFGDLQNLQFGSPAWDVFDAEGRYLGVVETPEGVTPRRFIGTQMYGVHVDDLGVQRVVRYRINVGED